MATERRQGERLGQPALTPADAAQRIYGTVRPVTLDEITIDPAIQVRVDGLDEARVEQYVEFLLGGGAFKDPIIVFQEGENLVLSAGFHRCEAYKRALPRFEPTVLASELAPLLAEIRQGGREAAIEFAEEDNLTHGLELRLKDKRHLLERRWLRGHAWQHLSNRAIAAKLGVNRETVAAWRAELEQVAGIRPPERVGKDGKTYNVAGVQAANQRRAEEQRESGRPEPSVDRMAAKLAELQEAVLAVVEGQPPMTYREIEFAVNAHLERIANPGLLSGAITQMTRDGRLRNVGGGRYAVPDAPEQALSDNRYQIEDKLSGNSLQIDGGEPAGGWLDRQAIKTPSMATAANGAPAHSDDHDPDIEAALLLRSELEKRVLRALDALGAVLTIQGIRSLYLLDADQLRGLYGDLNDLSALGAEIHEYAEMQLGRMRLMGRTGRPYDEGGDDD